MIENGGGYSELMLNDVSQRSKPSTPRPSSGESEYYSSNVARIVSVGAFKSRLKVRDRIEMIAASTVMGQPVPVMSPQVCPAIP